MPIVGNGSAEYVGRRLPQAHPRRPEAYGNSAFGPRDPVRWIPTRARTPRLSHCPARSTRVADRPDSEISDFAWSGTGVESSSVLARIAATVGQVPHVLLRDSEARERARPHRQIVVDPDPRTLQESRSLPVVWRDRPRWHGGRLKGRDNDLGRDLAVKVLLESHREKPELIRRFVEEAQIGGQLQHPGIVPIYELGTFAERRPFSR